MYWNKTTGLLTAHNGMDLSKSRENPNSRYSRVIDYIRKNGESTKADIIRNVFGRVIVPIGLPWYPSGPNNEVTRGWGAGFWSLMVANGDLIKTRKGNTVVYSLPTEN